MDKDFISIYAHEDAMARMERSNSRSWFLCIVLIVILLATNSGWLYYESQQENIETTSIQAEQDGSGVNIIGGSEVVYGAEGEDSQN